MSNILTQKTQYIENESLSNKRLSVDENDFIETKTRFSDFGKFDVEDNET